MAAFSQVEATAMPLPKRTSEVESDSDSTAEGSSIAASVVRRLVEIPREQGLENITLLLELDMLNRYQAKKPELNFLLQSGRAFAKLRGHEVDACALNSGGTSRSALGLEAMKRVLFPDDAFDKIRVYSNAFTFHAVPSACVVAGFAETLKLIEATEELVLDLDHLEGCIKEDLASGRFANGKMILVLSYMRGRVCAGALQQVRDAVIGGLGPRLRVLVRRQDVRLLRGGVDDLQQANKLVNTGEGGMVFTNNDEMQAFFIFSAGSYEELWRKHEELAPPEDVCLKYKCTVANKSVRMTNLQAALMVPQINVMQERIDHHNAMYNYLAGRTSAKFEELCGEGSSKRMVFIPQAHELVGPVYDSLQLRIMKDDGTAAQEELPALSSFLKMMQERKYSIAKFSDPANARNYKSWQYLKGADITPEVLPKTARALLNVCDLRMLCHDTELEMEKLATDIAECFKSCFVN
eukprot:CAMPEP_0177460900 /NCGR_PEP_ID=MMETSP0369-20130122/14921_1 /TAXON_ID=447022 ORGANISM="Scrippsiella hangoei-like, Strain SHHI-4" /NCGR_SAMPLE_ID=MMETSP0369 /ASSEMBLY_ACC=CAM_ASM_000364 /LENGTH=465 /DNA_ID=CAMNT_0018934337 /DNA_START=81 /DNA_END=1478 /DNA_ORIENTATION=-